MIRELQKLPDGIHIFCRRTSDGLIDDNSDALQRVRLDQEAKQRRELFFSALPLLAYDGEECGDFHQWLYHVMDSQLTKCEACIRQYYMGQVSFKEQLLQDYEDAEVQQFLSIIHRKDISRIKAGLDSATIRLEPLAREKRGPKALDNKQLFALFETLHCEVFFEDEKLLQSHFDKPFTLVQTHRELKINEILPAITKFLFSTNSYRREWATKTWQRLGRSLTDEEWDWATKSIITRELDAVRDDAGLVRFWSAIKVICESLSKEQIQLKLFDLGFNFGRLFLDHLAKPTLAIQVIVGTLSQIWKKAPDVYWQNLQAVSAATVAEQVFNSPKFTQMLEADIQKEHSTLLAWTKPFLDSLQPANRPPAARTLVHQLLALATSDKASPKVKQLCFDCGVNSLLATVKTFSESDENREVAARPVLCDVLALVSTHLTTILDFQNEGSTEQKANTRDSVVGVVRNVLALECQMLKMDFEALSNQKPIAQNSSHTPDLWRTVNRHLDADQPDLSQALLISTMYLMGLEKFQSRAMTPCKTEKESFNAMFSKVEDLLSQCIDHMAEFPAEHLDKLFAQQNTNMALTALLFSGNDSIYQATVEIFKNTAGQPGRVEALSHVTQAFFANTLYSMCWVNRRISTLEPFSPIPRLLQTAKDVLDILCDSNTGQLRNTRNLTSRDRDAAQAYWQYSWQVLTTIFRKMEKWSTEVGDKQLMTEVCRNTMQYAEELFGHYSVFSEVLTRISPLKKSDLTTAEILLNNDRKSTAGSPVKALDSMVKWLRLRDEYLAKTLVSIITGMLGRLKALGTQLPEDVYALTFVEQVAAPSTVKGQGTKTILDATQKAELVRALERYTGRQIAIHAKPVKKQQRLDSWTDPNVKQEFKPKPEIIAIDDDDESTDSDLRMPGKSEVDKVDALRKQALLQEKKAQKLQDLKRKSSIPAAKVSHAVLPTRPDEQRKALLERRKKEEAEQQAKRKELIERRKAGLAGSGLAGLGVVGKDHSAPRSDLMVSSESEEEDSSEDELFGSSKPKVAQTTNKLTGRPVPMPVKKVKQTRSAKDMRARLSPDLTGLHKTILAWDFFADTDTPPNSSRDDYTLVTNTFRTVEDYQTTFEPLLVLEGWQSFRTAREDGTFKPFEVKVANSMIIDNFFEINSTVPFNEGKELGLSAADVVLLSKGSRPNAEPNEPHCLARVKEVSFKRGEMQIVYRINSDKNPLRNHLHDKTVVWAVKILSLTPLEREYGALRALPYYDLSEEIIRAKPSPLLNYSDSEVHGIQKLHNLNTAQAKAVRSAIDNDAFTLIQGPPGSGKTKTITAILSAILTGSAATNGHHTMTASAPPSSKKILVAAPSNAAVDELVMRFKDGVKMPGGSTQKINVVRLGRSEAINAAVRDVTLEELVTARLEATPGTNGKKEDIHAVMMEHKQASEEMLQLNQKVDAARQKGEQISSGDDQLREALRRKKQALGNRIDQMKEQQNSAGRDADLLRKKVQQEILNSAHVLCATLSGSGHEVFQGLNVEFETVIIDEAAQSIELSALIPLKYGCSKCILVGDPKQLPPTVLSRQAAKYQYEQSLFARMASNHEKDVHLLDVQYRMHPEISAFPSKTFYDSKLRDGDDMARLRARPWHRSQLFSPYRFFDVEGMSKSAPKGRSLVNDAEIDAALAIYDRLTSDMTRYDFKNKIGIITPYKGQLKALKHRFSIRYGEAIWNRIEFNTTDAFQGRESEIIIFSCVRASTQGIGFLNDVRRMNVGLTRAKCSLWVLGNSDALIQGEFWKALVLDARERGLYTKDDIVNLMSRAQLTEDMMKDDIEMGGMDEAQSATPATPASISSAGVSVAPSRDGTATPAFDTAASKQNSRVQSAHSSRASTPQNGDAKPRVQRDATTQPPNNPALHRSTPVPSRPGPLSRQSSVNSMTTFRPDVRKPQGLEMNRQQFARTQSPSMSVNGHPSDRHVVNGNKTCNICGSDEHLSHHCDNEKAREASVGNCHRCGKVGHTRKSCVVERCMACGDFDHVEQTCTSPSDRRLPTDMRKDVERQETEHQKLLQRHREERVRKQLGEHGASVPQIKTSKDIDSKRKRSPEDGRLPNKRSNPGNAPASAPQRPAALQKPGMGPSGPRIVRKKIDKNSMIAK